jgi:predicted adenylyl cyclase CyaB
VNLNVEIKVPDRDPVATLERCRLLDATDEGLLHQRDTYFAVATGRLKLREELSSGTAEMIFYERPSDDGIRPSRYVRARVDGEETRLLLGHALGVCGVVTKKRRLFLWDGVRIHLDEVERLGDFIELEAVVTDQMNEVEARTRMDALIESFAIDVTTLEPRGYLDLLQRDSTP